MADIKESMTLDEFLNSSMMKQVKDELLSDKKLIIQKRQEIEDLTEKELNRQESYVKEQRTRTYQVEDKNKKRIQDNNDRIYEMNKARFDVAKTFALKSEDPESQEKWFNTMTGVQLEAAEAIVSENEELKNENEEVKEELKKEKEKVNVLEEKVKEEKNKTVITTVKASAATVGVIGVGFLIKKYGPKALNYVLTNMSKLLK